MRGKPNDRTLSRTVVDAGEIKNCFKVLDSEIFSASTQIHELLQIPKRAGIIATESPNPELETLYKKVLAYDDERHWHFVLLGLLDHSHTPSAAFFSDLISAYITTEVIEKPSPWQTADDILKSFSSWKEAIGITLHQYNCKHILIKDG